jgi:hypothetical protein
MTNPYANPEANPASDDLVTLTTRPTEFEANTLVAVLQEAGIEAFAFGIPALTPLGMRIGGCPVQVRQADLDRAKRAISQNVADSVDIDWDEVDVGQREDNLPLSNRSGMPWLARVGATIVAVIVVGMIIAFLLGVGIRWL